MNKKNKAISLSFFLMILLIGFVSSTTYCCERTVGENPAWCQNMPSQESCNSSFGNSPAYCDATSYCRQGTCIDTSEGKCTTSAERKCKDEGGSWDEKNRVDLPQCQLGCCLVGGGASFTTQVGCNKQSLDYGLKIEYKAGITDEITCLANANPEAKGACVFTEDYTINCDMTTKKECNTVYSVKSAYSDVSFHEGYLCTATELKTICAKSEKTVCEGDDVYFLDTCENLANIYDSSKKDDDSYWTKIQDTKSVCGDSKGNKNSTSCGDCDYILGSMCKRKETGDDVDLGDYLCKSLDCEDYREVYSGAPEGIANATHYPKHREEWCASEKGNSPIYYPGDSDFILTCFNGEVTKSECDSNRQEYCLESTDNSTGYKSAGCIANEWQFCYNQTTAETCLEVETRDCRWVNDSDWNGYYFNLSGTATLLINKPDEDRKGICLPKYAPRVEASSKVAESCGLASSVCNVKLQKWWLASEEKWKCNSNNKDNNCSCYTDANGNIDKGQTWANTLNQICIHMGDCGNKTNYFGRLGYQSNPIVINDPEK